MLVMPLGGIRDAGVVALAQNLVNLGQSFAHHGFLRCGKWHDLQLDLDLQPISHAGVLVEFDGSAVDPPVHYLGHG